jgi:TolB-like protein
MGEVYRARDTELGREVALKLLPETLADDPEHLTRMRREARLLASLNHPNVATLYAFEGAAHPPYLVMELVSGRTLAELLQPGPLPVSTAAQLGAQIAEGLAAAHACGVVHRDAKPANVKITPSGQVKLLDFGLAKLTPAGGEDSLLSTATGAAPATRQGQVLGTVPYMSPEQARGQGVDERTDVWALGCVLYEALTGRSPFLRGTVADTLSAILGDEPDWRRLPPETPPPLARLLRRCLDKRPEERPADLEAVSRELRSSAAPSRGRWASRVLAVLAVGLVVGGAVVVVRPLVPRLLLTLADLQVPPPEPALPERPSVAVLPFASLSEDTEQDYFADGITEDLTTDLSRIPGIFVISRSSANVYGGRDVPAERIGRELGVRYLVEGTVRRAGDQVRISARLTDTQSGFEVWSQRYDRHVEDLFATQAAIAQEILEALQVELRTVEVERILRKPTTDLRAWESFSRGYSHFVRFTREDNEVARRLFARAVELDPRFAEAQALLGSTLVIEYSFGWTLDPGLVDRADGFAQRALELDPESPPVHTLLANVHLARGETRAAIAAAQRAVELAPNIDVPHLSLGLALAMDGKPVVAVRSFNRALRLNPRAPTWWLFIIGNLRFIAGRQEEAIELWERVRAAYPDMLPARLPLIAWYESQGQHEHAREIAREVLRINPDFSLERAREFPSSMQIQRLGLSEDLLRRAGLP